MATVPDAASLVRRSLAVVEMIAQEAKFCKPLLTKFGKGAQSAGWNEGFGRGKAVHYCQIQGRFLIQNSETIQMNLADWNFYMHFITSSD